jgi:hypothetical protein
MSDLLNNVLGVVVSVVLFAALAMVLTRRPGAARQRAAASSGNAPQVVNLRSLPAGHPFRQRVRYESLTECDPRHSGFVSQFGVKRNTLVQLVCIVPEGGFATLPPEVAAMVEDSYAKGLSRGQEVAQFRAGSYALKPDECLYFAVVAFGDYADTVCFVHQRI